MKLINLAPINILKESIDLNAFKAKFAKEYGYIHHSKSDVFLKQFLSDFTDMEKAMDQFSDYLLSQGEADDVVAEDEGAVRNAKIRAMIEDIKAKEIELKDAKEKLRKIKSNIEEATFSMSSFYKSLLEAPEDTTGEDEEEEEDPAPDAPLETPEPEEEEEPTDEPTGQAKAVKVKFNMSNVKKYNTMPVSNNQGYITSATKDGLVVKVDDTNIIVNYQDIATD